MVGECVNSIWGDRSYEHNVISVNPGSTERKRTKVQWQNRNKLQENRGLSLPYLRRVL